MSVPREVARRIGSWYPGVPVHQVADAEGVAERVVRAARMQLGKEPELGAVRLGQPAPRLSTGPVQMTFAELEVQMRSNRGVCQ